jgi:hypothetical protein
MIPERKRAAMLPFDAREQRRFARILAGFAMTEGQIQQIMKGSPRGTENSTARLYDRGHILSSSIREPEINAIVDRFKKLRAPHKEVVSCESS